MEYFRYYLNLNGNIPSRQVPRFVRWVSRCYAACGELEGTPLCDRQVETFIAQIASTHTDHQVQQATRAIAAYRHLYHQVQSEPDGQSARSRWEPLLFRLALAARLQNLPDTTGKAYAQWVTSFLEFWEGVQPTDLSYVHALLYLQHISGGREFPTAMRSQTAAALNLFFRYVVQRDRSGLNAPGAGGEEPAESRMAS